MKKTTTDELLTPITHTTKAFYIFVGILIVIIAWFGYALYTQYTLGFAATGMRDIPGGAPWGFYIANAIYFEDIASSGAVILVMIYLFKLEKYKPVARIGIAMTCTFLALGILSLTFDIGRPDRAIVNLFIYGQVSSPFIWDLVFILNNLVLSLIAAYLMLRLILPASMGKVSKWRQRIYRPLLGGYADTRDNRILTERMMKGLSVGFLIFIVMVHAFILQYIFGSMVGRPGWYNPFLGLFFFTTAIAAGLAAIIVVAAIVRSLYKWQKHIKLEIFTGLGKFLAALNAISLFLIFIEQVTWRFMGTAAEFEISQAWLFGDQAWLFWPIIVMLVASTLILLTPRAMTVGGIFVASALSLGAYWIDPVLLITSSLLHPLLPYSTGVYAPTWVEWSIMGGFICIGILIITLFIKVFPVMELRARKGAVKSG